MNDDSLIARYRYGAQYVGDFQALRSDIAAKTFIPHQVEFQPPPRGRKICWLDCPYCYGGSAHDDGRRLSKSRALEVMAQIAQGGVKKIIFAGYATDPLNCEYIDDLLRATIDSGQIFGFNTKALKLSEAFLGQLSRPDIAPQSYMSISVDAGCNEVYNAVHDVRGNAKLYDRVLQCITRAGAARRANGNLFDLSATYLINGRNHDVAQVQRFICDFKAAGCNMLRFAFAQPPRGIETADGVVPTADDVRLYGEKLRPVIAAADSAACTTMLVDADSDHDIYDKARTVPCFARFSYPTVGFDGWLYHCSQSSAPNFHGMAIGDLNSDDFWPLLYDYDGERLGDYFSACGLRMNQEGCRCDRKEHVLNARVIASGAFDDLVVK